MASKDKGGDILGDGTSYHPNSAIQAIEKDSRKEVENQATMAYEARVEDFKKSKELTIIKIEFALEFHKEALNYTSARLSNII